MPSSTRLRRVKRDERVLERRGRTSQPTGDAAAADRVTGGAQPRRQQRDLLDSMFDQERLSRQTYLDIPELCAYGRFVEHGTGRLRIDAAFCWLHETQLPRARRGRRIFVLRRDVDEAMQAQQARE